MAGTIPYERAARSQAISVPHPESQKATPTDAANRPGVTRPEPVAVGRSGTGGTRQYDVTLEVFIFTTQDAMAGGGSGGELREALVIGRRKKSLAALTTARSGRTARLEADQGAFP